MPLRLYNSLTRTKEDFVPLAPPAVGLYTCGPTVYNYQHVGNYRTYIFEDALVRTLNLLGFKPRRVMNVTDVGHLASQGDDGEDKMELGAAREGKTAWEIAKFYTDAFLADSRALNLLP
ncbi:MAG TPA: cysteine--tRNA ligase, partial [Elusimicrobiota bacterium]|nr:cysteine--tRNA ligase [Elusimicrobiota bacterium]